MAGFDGQANQEFKDQILAVSKNFSDAGFKQLVRRLKVLKETETFFSLEAWLKGLIEEKIFLAHGLLSWLYYSIQNYEEAADQALLANKHFPDTEIWDNLAKNALTDEAIELTSC